VVSHRAAPGQPSAGVTCALADDGRYGVIQFANVTSGGGPSSPDVAAYFSEGLGSTNLWQVNDQLTDHLPPALPPAALDYAAILNITARGALFGTARLSSFRVGYGSNASSAAGAWWIGGADATWRDTLQDDNGMDLDTTGLVWHTPGADSWTVFDRCVGRQTCAKVHVQDQE
jgi:hypothetical protein